jgi:putative spermidine/putrescine transport system substrate-binding protein
MFILPRFPSMQCRLSLENTLKYTAITVILMSALFSGTAAAADTSDGNLALSKSWAEIEDMARGSEVNWFMWGGADNINSYVSAFVGGILRDKYGIKLNRVGINDTVDAVNIVLGEKEAGVVDKGSIDMIWVNGENFRTMKQAGLAWCGYTGKLPNNDLVNWDNPAIANDFGIPVEGCEVPWNTAQFAFAYDPSVTSKTPTTIPELLDWVKANPGRFTYPAPPDFNGSAFVRHVFYFAAGGANNLLGAFDQAKFDVAAAKAWKILNDIEPYLWREGKTYPNTITQMNELFANKEVALNFNYDPSQFGQEVKSGKYPESVRSYGLSDGTIGNTNYTIVPFNSPHKAAALVLQNILLSGDAQFEKARPEVWGTAPAIDVSRTSASVQAKFAAIVRHPSVVSSADLAKRALPELQAEWITAIEKGWQENVAK